MPNVFKVTTWMAKEYLRHLENSLSFTKYVNKEYLKDFTEKSFRPGTSINIPKPARFTATNSATASFPDVAEDSVSLTVSQWNTSMAPTSLEMTTSVMRDQWSDRYIRPQAIALASQIDADGLALALTTVGNAVGTPATTPTIANFLAAKAITHEQGAPVDDRISAIVSPQTEADILDASKALFHGSSEIEKQYKEGKMGMAYGMKWSMDQLIATRTVGVATGTPLVDGASQTGATGLVTKGWTNGQTNILKKGDLITLSGVYSVNPITKQSTGRLLTFTVTANANSGSSTGPATLFISPVMVASGTTQNVSALPADGATITVSGAGGAASQSNLVFHQDAFTLAVVPMVTYGGLDKSAVEYDPDTGIAIRVTQGVDVTNDKLLVRVDALYGWATTRGEWACRVER